MDLLMLRCCEKRHCRVLKTGSLRVACQRGRVKALVLWPPCMPLPSRREWSIDDAPWPCGSQQALRRLLAADGHRGPSWKWRSVELKFASWTWVGRGRELRLDEEEAPEDKGSGGERAVWGRTCAALQISRVSALCPFLRVENQELRSELFDLSSSLSPARLRREPT